MHASFRKSQYRKLITYSFYGGESFTIIIIIISSSSSIVVMSWFGVKTVPAQEYLLLDL
jgi:F0F1-type ATP synthase assembly protein I